LVYVIVVLPTEIEVTNPVGSIVATAVLEDAHAFVVAAVADPVNKVVSPIQIFKLPEMVGNGLTVMTSVVLQLLLFVNVIVAVPAATPVTIPVVETVATAVLEEIQGLVKAPTELAVNAILCPAHTKEGPVIIGIGLTTKVWLALVVPHSLVTERLIV